MKKLNFKGNKKSPDADERNGGGMFNFDFVNEDDNDQMQGRGHSIDVGDVGANNCKMTMERECSEEVK